MDNKPIFCGTGQIIETKYGLMPKVYFAAKDLQTLSDWLASSDGDLVTVVMKKKHHPKGKTTHYCCVDEWKPSGQSGDYSQERKPAMQTSDRNDEPQTEVADDDLPF